MREASMCHLSRDMAAPIETGRALLPLTRTVVKRRDKPHPENLENPENPAQNPVPEWLWTKKFDIYLSFVYTINMEVL